MKDTFFIGDWKVESQLNRVSRNAEINHLEPKVMSVLVVLAENAGEVVTKEKLLETIWKDIFVTEQVLKVAVSELRKALNDDARNPSFINTVPKRGYQLIALVRQSEIDLDVYPKSNPENRERLFNRRNARLAIAVALLILFSFSIIWIYEAWDTNVRPSPSIKSIAVLPLRNSSKDRSEAFFSDGLTETITAYLSKLGKVKVISSRSALVYKNSDKTLSQIADELNVDALLEGTIMRNGDKIRLNVNLIDGKTGRLIWADTYQNDLSDIFELQSKLSYDIARQIGLKLAKSSSRSPKVKPEAYEAYLRGRFLWNKRKPVEMRKSLDHFQKALELEPNNALFHSGLADAYTLLAFYRSGGSEELYKKAKFSASKALKLDKNLAEAHTSLAGVLHKYDVDWEGASREFQIAIRLNPNYPTAHQWYAIYLASKGNCNEALSEINTALELDPLSMVMRTDKGWLLHMCGRSDEAISQLEGVRQLDQNYGASYFLILAYCEKDLFEKAIAEANQSISSDGQINVYHLLLAYSEARAGRKTQAEARLQSVIDLPSRRPWAYEIGLVYLALGRQNKAIDYFGKVVGQRTSWQPFLKHEPELKDIQQHPRFRDLLKKLNFDG